MKASMAVVVAFVCVAIASAWFMRAEAQTSASAGLQALLAQGFEVKAAISGTAVVVLYVQKGAALYACSSNTDWNCRRIGG